MANRECTVICNATYDAYLLQETDNFKDLKIGDFDYIIDTNRFNSSIEKNSYLIFNDSSKDITDQLSDVQKNNLLSINYIWSFFDKDQYDNSSSFITRDDIYSRYLRGDTTSGNLIEGKVQTHKHVNDAVQNSGVTSVYMLRYLPDDSSNITVEALAGYDIQGSSVHANNNTDVKTTGSGIVHAGVNTATIGDVNLKQEVDSISKLLFMFIGYNNN